MQVRAVFKTALRKYAFQGETRIYKSFTPFLLSSSDKEFEDFFKNTEAATFAFKNNEKTTHSIRSVLSSQIECLRNLAVSDILPEQRKNLLSIEGASAQTQTASFFSTKLDYENSKRW
jgi:hypothetical protein